MLDGPVRRPSWRISSLLPSTSVICVIYKGGHAIYKGGRSIYKGGAEHFTREGGGITWCAMYSGTTAMSCEERDYKGLHAFPSSITRDDPPIKRDDPASLLTLQGRSLTGSSMPRRSFHHASKFEKVTDLPPFIFIQSLAQRAHRMMSSSCAR